MDIMQHITRYARGELSRQEIMLLWGDVLNQPEYMELMEFYTMLKTYYNNVPDPARK